MNEKPSHNRMMDLLPISRYINESGMIDYEMLRSDPWLTEQIPQIESAKISELNREDQLAFWLNAYNILTLKSILQKLESDPEFTGNLGPWRKFLFFIWRKHSVAGRKLSLNHIEHKIIRKQFQDPRVHFVLNCGSASCPVLYNRLFSGATLENYLENATDQFINNSLQVHFDHMSNTLYLSKIFKWYKRDFSESGGIIPFIQKFWSGNSPDLDHAKIKFRSYDWKLNRQ